MAYRIKKRYDADDELHSIKEKYKNDVGELVMECDKCGGARAELYDTRVTDYYICALCYFKLMQNNDWKCWKW